MSEKHSKSSWKWNKNFFKTDPYLFLFGQSDLAFDLHPLSVELRSAGREDRVTHGVVLCQVVHQVTHPIPVTHFLVEIFYKTIRESEIELLLHQAAITSVLYVRAYIKQQHLHKFFKGDTKLLCEKRYIHLLNWCFVYEKYNNWTNDYWAIDPPVSWEMPLSSGWNV